MSATAQLHKFLPILKPEVLERYKHEQGRNVNFRPRAQPKTRGVSTSTKPTDTRRMYREPRKSAQTQRFPYPTRHRPSSHRPSSQYPRTEHMEVEKPFELPYIESRPYHNTYPVTSFVSLVETFLRTPADEIMLVNPENNTQTLEFARVLDWICDKSQAQLEDIILIHRDEFELHKDNLVESIHEQFSHTYSQYYNVLHHRRRSDYIQTLEDELNSCQLQVMHLKNRNRQLQAERSSGYTDYFQDDSHKSPYRYHLPTEEQMSGQQNIATMLADLANECSDDNYEDNGDLEYDQMSEMEESGDYSDKLKPETEQNGELGEMVGQDEVGPIYDYSHLTGEGLHLRGGGGGNFNGGKGSIYFDGEDDDDDEEIFLSRLPPGLQQRARRAHGGRKGEDDDVDRSNPMMYWGGTTDNSTTAFSEDASSSRNTSSVSNPYASSSSSRIYAPAFKFPDPQDQDNYNPYKDTKGYTLARARPGPSTQGQWTTFDPKTGERRWDTGAQEQNSDTNLQSDNQTHVEEMDKPRNQALEATFNTTSVIKTSDPESKSTIFQTQYIQSSYGGDVGHINSTELGIDRRFENPYIDVDEEIRKNFLPINEMMGRPDKHEDGDDKPPAVAPGTIINMIGGKEYIHVPKQVDKRLSLLDRNQNYIGRNQGQISKRLLKAHRENVQERDYQMFLATKQYRMWKAMAPEERMKRLEALRKPIKFWEGVPGAAVEDLEEIQMIPEVNTRASARRIRDWMGSTSVSYSISRSDFSTRSRESTVDSFQPLGDLGDDDENRDFSATPRNRTQEELEDLLRNVILDVPDRPSTFSVRSDSTIQGHRSASNAQSDFTTRGERNARHQSRNFSGSGSSEVTNESRPIEDQLQDLLLFDDTPELQIPEDTTILPSQSPTVEQDKIFRRIKEICKIRGRAVTVRLHQLVKFTPGAITRRVFGGVIQEIQLHPRDRVAIVIFLHCAEASAFVRHIKSITEHGTAHERRELQIEAGWYKGHERSAFVPPQSKILANHIAMTATRTLKLHLIPLEKTKEQVSSELGIRLQKLLVSVKLCTPQQRYKQEQFGRQAILEFASIKDAIEAKDALCQKLVAEYEWCQPKFVDDISSEAGLYKSYCRCMGCKEHEKAQQTRRQAI